MNTQALSAAFGGTGGGSLSLGGLFHDFPASQDNYLEFAEFSQVTASCSVKRCLSTCLGSNKGGCRGCLGAKPGCSAITFVCLQGDGYSGIDELSLGVQQVRSCC